MVVSKHEQLARNELAQAYRIATRLGLSEMGAGLISSRLPPRAPQDSGADPALAEYLLLGDLRKLWPDWTRVEAGDLSTVQQTHRGEFKLVNSPTDARVPPYVHAAWQLHFSMHCQCPQFKYVMHVHTPEMAIFSGLKAPRLLRFGQDQARVVEFRRHRYTDPPEKLCENLGRSRVLLLDNHGLLVVGASLAEVVMQAYEVNRAVKTQLLALAAVGGDESRLSPWSAVEWRGNLDFRVQMARDGDASIGCFDGDVWFPEWIGLTAADETRAKL